ncbi:MAG TPA: glycerophosphodiester phosphodiesterase family protein [Chloroflexota bacterium]|nr:glycerophosphodiester phosphodiesterase family protein [Chloroflexota bacterium]
MIVIAHRGASAYAPENTTAAFDLAIEMGSDAFETDIQASRDGVLVLIHDEKVDRTTNGQGAVKDFAFAELRALDANVKHPESGPQRIPTLDEFLDTYVPRLPAYLEIKAPGVEQASVEAVRRRGLLDRVVFTSFYFDSVKQIAESASVRTCWTMRSWTPEAAARAKTATLSEVSINVQNMTPEVAAQIRDGGLGVRCWGLANEDLMRRAVAAEVDGVTIDFPDVLLRYLGR